MSLESTPSQPDETSVLARDHDRGRARTAFNTVTLVAGPYDLRCLFRCQGLGEVTCVLDIDEQSLAVSRFRDAGHPSALGGQHLLADQHEAYLALAQTSC